MAATTNAVRPTTTHKKFAASAVAGTLLLCAASAYTQQNPDTENPLTTIADSECAIVVVSKTPYGSASGCQIAARSDALQTGHPLSADVADHVLEQNQLGLSSNLTIGPGYTDEQARKWFERQAKKGDPAAQVNLAVMYANGWGTPVNYGAALLWLRAAAYRHFALAYYNLGIFYLLGRGVHRDYAEAFHWFQQAAELGDSAAQADLAYMFDQGLSVPKNSSTAAAWYRKAAESGNSVAENNIADLYLRGEGVPQNDLEAYRWFRRAAEQGHTGARIMLGYLCAQGRGTSRDPVAALSWVMAAFLAGDDRGKALADSLAAQLAPEQVVQARNRALALQPPSRPRRTSPSL